MTLARMGFRAALVYELLERPSTVAELYAAVRAIADGEIDHDLLGASGAAVARQIADGAEEGVRVELRRLHAAGLACYLDVPAATRERLWFVA